MPAGKINVRNGRWLFLSTRPKGGKSADKRRAPRETAADANSGQTAKNNNQEEKE